MTELSRADIQSGLQEVFRNVFNDQSLILSDAHTAADIEGWDSLQQIKIILACEKRFGIKLRARDINGLGNVGDIVDHIKAAIDKAARK